MQREQVSGVWVPLITPFEDERLALQRLPPLVDWLLQRGIRGFLSLGTTGEAPHLTDEECVEAVQAAAHAINGRVPLLAGSGRASVHATVAMSRRLLDAGADAVLVLTPFYYRGQTSPAGLVEFYHTVAASLSEPTFVYHIPQVTGIDLSAEVLRDVLEHPNVWGFKDSSLQDGPLAALLRQLPERNKAPLALIGGAARVREGLQLGAAGAILAVANIVPETAVALFDACASGETARAALLQRQLADVARALQGRAIAGIKAGLEMREQVVGSPRAPLTPATPEQRAVLARCMQAALAAV